MALVAAVGCSSSDYCSAFSSKQGTCAVSDAGGPTQSSCETALNSSSCSAADRTALSNQATCINAVPACTPATQTAFGLSLLACVVGDGGINLDAGTAGGESANCQAAISGS